MQDYQSERIEVLSQQGTGYPFTRGDYIVKLLLGAIDPYFDLLVSYGWGMSEQYLQPTVTHTHASTHTHTMQTETRVPEDTQPLPFPSFPPLPGKLHYRSSSSEGVREPSSTGGAIGVGGSGGVVSGGSGGVDSGASSGSAASGSVCCAPCCVLS